MSLHVRRVVTGHDDQGNAVFVSDGPPPHAVGAPGGTAVATLWSLAGPPASPDDGGDPEGGFPLEPPPGGMTMRVIRLPLPDQSLPREQQFLHNRDDAHFSSERPGMHATATLDLEWIVDGEIELELEDGCVRLGPGDCCIQRGTQHRWRVVGDKPCTYIVAMFALDPAAEPPAFALVPRAGDPAVNAGPRRLVTGVDAAGRSCFLSDGPAPNCVAFDGGAGMVQGDLWQTGGAVGTADQGGDADPVQITLDPYGMGIGFKYVELPSDDARAAGFDPARLGAHMGQVGRLMRTTGHHDPQDPGNHKTDTIDIDVIIEGTVELELPGHGSKLLGAGDVVVQRGTWHKWHNRGHGPARWFAIMIGAPVGGRRAGGA
jgi:mannose-6-phosphate isomerase-like protein (cupin superfamily)